MKKIIYTFMAVALFGVSSCNESILDIEQKGVSNIEGFYKTDEDAASALTAMYADFATYVAGCGYASGYSPLFTVFNSLADDIYAGGAHYSESDPIAALNDYRFDANNEAITNLYNGLYKSIYSANLIIIYFGDNADTDFKKQAVAEARVIRAYDHLMLAIGWGTPPIVDHLMTNEEYPTNAESQKAVFTFCIEECEAALAVLPERKTQADKEGTYRVTKGFAQGVAGKAAVFAGNNAKAASILGNLVNSGKYALVPGEKFQNLFHVEGDGCEEKIFEANISVTDGPQALDENMFDVLRQRSMEPDLLGFCSGSLALTPFYEYTGMMNCSGRYGIQPEFAKAIVANEGESYRRKATFSLFSYMNDYYLSERKECFGWTDETKSNPDEIGISDVKDGLRGLPNLSENTGVIPVKFLPRKDDFCGTDVRMNNVTIMRYAEVLLLYVEACCKEGKTIDALKFLQEIQKRAGSGTISATVDIDVIKKEKQYELWMEGCRWADLVRWGDAEQYCGPNTDRIQAVYKTFDRQYREIRKSDDVKCIISYGGTDRYYVVRCKNEASEYGEQVGFVKGKHNLLPFPQSAIDRSQDHLKQNPGW